MLSFVSIFVVGINYFFVAFMMMFFIIFKSIKNNHHRELLWKLDGSWLITDKENKVKAFLKSGSFITSFFTEFIHVVQFV